MSERRDAARKELDRLQRFRDVEGLVDMVARLLDQEEVSTMRWLRTYDAAGARYSSEPLETIVRRLRAELAAAQERIKSLERLAELHGHVGASRPATGEPQKKGEG